MSNVVFLSLGSNIGDLIKNIDDAIDYLKCNNAELLKISRFYETKPYGEKEQENFVNIVAEFSVKNELDDFFKLTKEIEKKIGRKLTKRWGPREIDIDILFWNDEVIGKDNLRIPHKDMLNRDFVLVPLKEIAPDLIHPVYNKRIKDFDLSKIEKTIIKIIDNQ